MTDTAAAKMRARWRMLGIRYRVSTSPPARWQRKVLRRAAKLAGNPALEIPAGELRSYWDSGYRAREAACEAVQRRTWDRIGD